MTPSNSQPEIVARYEWNADEYFDAHRLHLNQHKGTSARIVLQILFGFMALVALIAFVKWRHDHWISASVILALSGAWVLLIWIVRSRWAARSNFARSGGKNEQVEWQFGADAITINTSSISTQLRWNAFIKVVCGSKGLLLYPSRIYYHWIPRNAFATEAEFNRARELLHANIERYYNVG